MEFEKFAPIQNKSPFEVAVETKEREGWQQVGREKLTVTKFNNEAMFNEVPLQTEGEIKERYLTTLQSQDPNSSFEIELLLDENIDKLRRIRPLVSEEEYQTMLEHLKDEDRIYLVFAKKILAT